MKSMICSVISLLGFLVSVSGQNCTGCPNTTVVVAPTYGRCDRSVDCYPYTTFLSFYEDNLYNQYKTAGDAGYALIIVHIVLAPALLLVLIALRTRNGDYMNVAMRMFSTRKALIWFSGVPVCLVDVVLFLWAPLTTIIYFTLFLHVAGTLLGLFVLMQTMNMNSADMLRKKAITLAYVNPQIAVDAYAAKHNIVLTKDCGADDGVNHDKFVCHICHPTITDSGVIVEKDRALGNGVTKAKAFDVAYKTIDGRWSVLPGYLEMKGTLAMSSHDAVHVGEGYCDDLGPVNIERSVSSAPSYRS